MICPFNCNKEDNPNFDKPAEHLIITVNSTGHTHCHGPFGNEFVIRKMLTAMIAEAEKNGIKFIPSTQDTIEK